MKTKIFYVYNDPGHAWVKVKLSFLKKINIQDKISYYSYLRGDYAYLEEDCDASLLLEALKNSGTSITWREHSSNKRSKIRNYEPFSTTKIDWEACRAL